ncbi:MAG: ATP-binding protein [Pseudomonadota bacterium]
MDTQPTDLIARTQRASKGRRPLKGWHIILIGTLALTGLAAAVSSGFLTTREGVIIAAFIGIAAVASALSSVKAEAVPSLIGEEIEDMRRLKRVGLLLNALPQPVLLLNSADQVETSNKASADVFGDHVDGSPIAGLIRAPQALDLLREVRHLKEAREVEFTLAGTPGLDALFYAAPLDPGPETDDRQIVVMIRDRTEQKKLERMRTDFIANAGHELRTPLSSILGFIETIRGHAKDDKDARERFLGIMHAQTERMLRLVQDLVSLSALELNERRLPEDRVDLKDVAITVHDMMEPVAASAGSTLLEVKGPDLIMLTGDRDQLIQVMQNLTDNALKYGLSSEDGLAHVQMSVGRGPDTVWQDADRSGDSPEQIAVRAGCRTDDLVYLRIQDQGQGIEKTDLPRLTERFYRIDAERSRSRGGTGLGLAIVKHIVGRHRGGILVESSRFKGSAFTCYFPPSTTSDPNLTE